MRRLLPALLVALSVFLLGAGPASAASRAKIIRDCSDDGQLQGSYTPSEVRDARKNLPSDVAEYTDCADVLRRAELPDDTTTPGTGTTGGGVPGTTAPSTGGTSPSGGATPAPVLKPETDQDRQALIDAREKADQPVTVGGANLLAGAAPLRDGYRANGLPTSLVIALILLGIAGLALSIPPVRRRLPFLGFRRS